MKYLAILLLIGCASTPPPSFERRTRQFEAGTYSEAVKPAKGSLFAPDSVAMLEDERPRKVGDVVVIRVVESDSASHDASTRLSRDAEVSVGLSGALERLAPNAGLAQLFAANTGSSLEGSGRFTRRGEVKAMLPVRVKGLLPNGDMYVEGTKVVVIGNEERQLYVSGIVRAADIGPDGSVPSTRVADADITYTGKGDATDQQQPGWLSRVLTYIWPF